MYLTRISIDSQHRKGIQLLNSPYRMHAAIEASFPSNAVRSDEKGRVLWRLDSPIGRSDCAWLYILSPDRPNCDSIIEQGGSPNACEPETKPYDDVLAMIKEGQRWQFRLKGNPVRKVAVDKGCKPQPGVCGTIRGHVTEAQQREWLLNRAETHGFSLMPSSSGEVALTVSHRRKERFKRGDREVTLATAQFDGVLEVTYADAFKRTLGFGLGRAKGFGCGLLTIAPVKAV